MVFVGVLFYDVIYVVGVVWVIDNFDGIVLCIDVWMVCCMVVCIGGNFVGIVYAVGGLWVGIG